MRRLLTYRGFARGGSTFVLSVVLLLALVNRADAQLRDSTQISSWTFTIAPYYWASAIAGSLTLEQPNDPLFAGNYVVDVGHKEELNPGFIGSASAGRGRWAAEVGVAASSVADSAMIQLLDMPTDSIPGYYDFSWSEASLRGRLKVGPYLSPYVTLYAGIRWVNWKYDLWDDATNSLGQWDETWVDPMVGANTNFGLGAGFSAHAHVDAAGFKIGSELSWTISGGLAYHVAGPLTLVGTYAYKQVSYDNQKRDDDLLVFKDGVAQGWVLGVSVSLPGRRR